uniref:Bowman-Birk serine protease inhibitors family domain-containing protein n=1 Tax=Leersia perrieri TaxID=77586 RepID=A0A0D9UW87_9ORYZ
MSTITMATTTILLLFLLATVAHGNTIRLPSEEKEERPPWKCCDKLVMLPERIFPPKWRCNDELDPSLCVLQCKVCQEAPGPFPGPLICDDVYWGVDPGPLCKPRPWGDCCDETVCTKSIPPICRCLDKVDKCAAACKNCKSSSETGRYVCQDWFTGEPGPKCKPKLAV